MGNWSLARPDQLPQSWWESWDRLNDLHLQAHPALRAVAVRLLISYFGGAGTRCATFAAGARILAQAIVEPAGFARWSLFAPSQAPVPTLVFDRSIVRTSDVLQNVLRTAPGVALALALPRQDMPFSFLDTSTSNVTHFGDWGNTVSVECQAGFDAYWNGRSRDLRLNIDRYLRRAEREGLSPRFSRIQGAHEIGNAVARYGLLESAGWKGRKGTALSPDNPQGHFYRALMCEYAAANAGSVYELYLGDRLAASRIAVSGQFMHVMLKTTYEEELRRHAPGRILLYLTLKDMLSAPSPRRIEFYTRADRDLILWCTHQRPIRDVTVYRNRWVARAVAMRRGLRQNFSAALSSPPGPDNDHRSA